jgi:hypothetical protein
MGDLYTYYKSFLVDGKRMTFSNNLYITMAFWQMKVKCVGDHILHQGSMWADDDPEHVQKHEREDRGMQIE